MKKSKYFKHWRQQHPAKRVNGHLRQLLAHYVSFFPEGAISELSEVGIGYNGFNGIDRCFRKGQTLC